MTDLPHVTEVIKAAGLMGDMSFVPDGAVELGTAVHAATHYLDDGDLDTKSLDPRVALRLASYQKFLDEMKPVIEVAELPVENHRHGYLGTLDRIVAINRKYGVLDIKGIVACEWHGLQLSAYLQAANELDQWKLEGRWNLYLRDDGYKLVERTRPDDWPAFVACLNLWKWKQNGG